MISEDFYGKKPFIWWTGIVENRMDPLQLGSVQVRIVGLHPIEGPEKNLVPTEKLPWAQIILPTNGVRTVSGPREGEWVFGFFQDGEYAQMPVVLGVFSGIDSEQSEMVYKEAIVRKIRGGSLPSLNLSTSNASTTGSNVSTSNTQSSNVISSINIFDVMNSSNYDLVSRYVPRMPKGQVERQPGNPATHPLARGNILGTGIDAVNNFLDASCDLSFLVNKEIAQARMEILKQIAEARARLEALFASQSTSPLVQYFKQLVVKIKKYLKMIKFIIEVIKDLIAIARFFLQFAIELVNWVLGLPSRLLELAKRCLSSILGPIGEAVNDVLGAFSSNNLNVIAGFGASFLSIMNQLSSSASSSSLSSVNTILQSPSGTTTNASNVLIGNTSVSNTVNFTGIVKVANNAAFTANSLDDIITISDSIEVNDEDIAKVAGKPFNLADYEAV